MNQSHDLAACPLGCAAIAVCRDTAVLPKPGFCYLALRELDMEIAAREAVSNAVVHGNQENPEKRVHVNCRCTIEGEALSPYATRGKGSMAVRYRIRRTKQTSCRPTGADSASCRH